MYLAWKKSMKKKLERKFSLLSNPARSTYDITFSCGANSTIINEKKGSNRTERNMDRQGQAYIPVGSEGKTVGLGGLDPG